MSCVRFFQILSSSLLICSCLKQKTSVPLPGTQPSGITSVPLDSSRVFSLSAGVYAAGTFQYDYTGTSLIRSVFGDSLPRTDSTRITAILIATYSPISTGRGFHVAIQADSVRTVPSSVLAVSSQYDTVTVEQHTGHVSVSRSDSVCAQSALDRIFYGDELVPSIPSTASPTRSWADSTTRSICRGGIRIVLNRITRYRFANSSTSLSSQEDSTRLVRITEVEMRGTGSQWQQQVEVSGRGSAIDTLTFAHSTHRLVKVAGESRAEFEFRSVLRAQRFEQILRTLITTRP